MGSGQWAMSSWQWHITTEQRTNKQKNKKTTHATTENVIASLQDIRQCGLHAKQSLR
jgi:hypothetical protein